MVTHIVNQIFYFYYILIILRIFLTWIPSIDWSMQPFSLMSNLTDPFLNIFRGIIPPIAGALDISPIIAILLLQFLQTIVVNLLSGLGI